MRDYMHKHHDRKPTPLWKWLTIILIVVAMPLFYSFISDEQVQQVFTYNAPEETQQNNTSAISSP